MLWPRRLFIINELLGNGYGGLGYLVCLAGFLFAEIILGESGQPKEEAAAEPILGTEQSITNAPYWLTKIR